MTLQQILGVVPKTLNTILGVPSKLEQLLGINKPNQSFPINDQTSRLRQQDAQFQQGAKDILPRMQKIGPAVFGEPQLSPITLGGKTFMGKPLMGIDPTGAMGTVENVGRGAVSKVLKEIHPTDRIIMTEFIDHVRGVTKLVGSEAKALLRNAQRLAEKYGVPEVTNKTLANKFEEVMTDQAARFNKLTQPLKNVGKLDDLLNQARKHKSAEEFGNNNVNDYIATVVPKIIAKYENGFNAVKFPNGGSLRYKISDRSIVIDGLAGGKDANAKGMAQKGTGEATRAVKSLMVKAMVDNKNIVATKTHIEGVGSAGSGNYWHSFLGFKSDGRGNSFLTPGMIKKRISDGLFDNLYSEKYNVSSQFKLNTSPLPGVGGVSLKDKPSFRADLWKKANKK